MSNPNVQGQRQRRLVLHFDINNTILMKDPAKGLNSVQMNVSIPKSKPFDLEPN